MLSSSTFQKKKKKRQQAVEIQLYTSTQQLSLYVSFLLERSQLHLLRQKSNNCFHIQCTPVRHSNETSFTLQRHTLNKSKQTQYLPCTEGLKYVTTPVNT